MNNTLERKSFTAFEKDTLDVIKNWFAGREDFQFQTSGSTGAPKTVTFSRQQLIKSAKRSLNLFKLEQGDKILLCLNPLFAAGFMTIVRAIEGNLDLIAITPGANPLASLPGKISLDFAAFTPNQIEGILSKSPGKLMKVKTILIGGAGIHPELEKKLQNIQPDVFHSYAMTETLTHIACRSVNGPSKSLTFKAVRGVSFDTDKRSCLIVDDKTLGIKRLITNDVVELLNNREFIWKGRIDNVVNSGGIKIQIEQVESIISQLLVDMNLELKFCMISLPDKSLTNKLILLIEKGQYKYNQKSLEKTIRDKLPKYHAPKKIVEVPEIFQTNTGKVDRNRNAKLYLGTADEI
ncbi:MAG: AMP-binding protein [Cytophagales bacterium]|nr:AMP-binding protein [Cytophagales bacterium]